MSRDADGVRRPSSRASMRQVAERAGVAMSSVSRVLSGHPDVSATMQERVMAVVAELGYQPDLLAQSLRRRETRSVGFVVGDIANPLLAEIVKGAERVLRDAGYSMLLTNSENRPERDAAHIRLFEQRRVDGLMLSLAAEDNDETIQLLKQFETPTVLVDRELPPDVGASAVLSDHRTGMRDAVGHLLDLGHRRIGLILGQSTIRPSRERRAGAEEAFNDRKLRVSYTAVEGMLAPDHGRNATRQLLSAAEPPTAIVAGSNQLLIGALEEILARDLTVGQDISLISCDAIDVTELFRPPIAVVRRDNREIGRQAAGLLLERLADVDPGARTVILPTTFTPRASCAPPRAT
jgi:LacI family transcriptional regulator